MNALEAKKKTEAVRKQKLEEARNLKGPAKDFFETHILDRINKAIEVGEYEVFVEDSLFPNKLEREAVILFVKTKGYEVKRSQSYICIFWCHIS